MIINFNSDGDHVSDFDIEDYYQKHKEDKEINISNYLLLTRFRLGVKDGDIDGISLFTTDIDGVIYESKTSKNGLMDNWDAPILSTTLNITMKLA